VGSARSPRIAVRRQLDRQADPAGQRVDDRRPDRGVGRWVERDLGRRSADPLAAALDHPELERQQLVEGEAAERRVPTLERVGIVRLLDRAHDRDQTLLGGDVGGQILRIGVAGLVERLADGRPQPD
jgi:hypothetical protein